jgi:hypothetical protein
MKLLKILFCVALWGADWQSALPEEPETWQQRPASLAIVNPPVRWPLAEVISLRGTWDFAVDPQARGRDAGWMRPKAPWPGMRTIEVPGCWEAQGVGEPGGSITWDIHFDCLPRPLRHVYRGSAWYRRVVAIPKAWDGKRVWLKIGGVRAQGWFWVGGRPAAHVDNYCGSYKYDVTDLVTPGSEAVVVALVRNDVPARKGEVAASHCFGGLYRDVELEATPATWIDNVWVQGDFDRRAAIVHAAIRSVAAAAPGPLRVDVRIRTLAGQPAGQASQKLGPPGKETVDLAIEVPLADFRPWSPETPALYVADVSLRDGDRELHGWQERFGVRKWEVRGKDFYLNGRKHFVRGFGDDYMYPVTLCSPASREEHRRHLELAREYGFNYVRHHTHCEVPEFYDAADELGIMVQPELPYYGNLVTEAFSFDPKRDLTELLTHYRPHVSLSTYCMGNEGHLGSPLDHELYALAKRVDPTRLVIHEDGGKNTAENSDFGSGRGAPDWGAYPQESDPRPWCHHEYLNLAVARDPRTAPKYTGAYQPPSLESFRSRLESLGLDPKWGFACIDAGHQLQRLYQKQGLEAARLNPGCHGYIYWTIASVDAWVDQGLLDPFWGVKASKPEFFRQFNGPTAVLAKTTPGARILAAGETLKIAWWISHFGPESLHNGKLQWKIRAGSEALGDLSLASVSGINAEAGDVKPVAEGVWRTPAVDKPVSARLTASLVGTDVENSWDLWLFPKLSPPAGAGAGLCAAPAVHQVLARRYPGMVLLGAPSSQQAKTLLTTTLDEAASDWLRQGKDVLLLRLAGPAPGVKLGWWGLSKQCGTAIAKHPAFGDFPHDGYLNELWFRIVDTAVPAGMPGLRGVEPLMVGDGQLGYLIHVFQAKAGKGRLLASGLDLLGDKPEAACLLDQFIQYVRSNRFQPIGILDLQQAANDWETWTALTGAVNGWAATTKTFHRVTYPSFWGERPMCVARQSGSEKLLTWNTRPVPADLDPAKRYTFRWFAALGWHTQPPGKFTLALGQRPLLDFDVVDRTTTWTSSDGTVALKYTLREQSGPDNSGVMELTLPAKLLTPGRPAELRVVPAQTGSQRWFGLYEWP